MKEVGQRIAEAMRHRGIFKQYLLADMVGVDQSAVTRWICGKGISLQHAIAISTKLQISMDWLIFGEGKIDRGNDHPDYVDNNIYPTDSLSLSAKSLIMELVNYMIKSEKLM